MSEVFFCMWATCHHICHQLYQGACTRDRKEFRACGRTVQLSLRVKRMGIDG